MYCNNISASALQNHLSDDVKIDHLRSVVIQGYASDFTHCFCDIFAVYNYVSVILGTPTDNFVNVFARFQFIPYVPKIVTGFECWRLAFFCK
jgi:hypothetical protein